jgi:putative ABC transport system substrate-binding protein
MLLALCSSAEAQQPKKVPRIGFLGGEATTRIAAFRQGMRELGYVEGKNIFIEHLLTERKADRERALAAELVRLKIDVIVTAGSGPTRAAKEVTATIPIVMAQDPDPVGNGFVTSLARPGGNVTGLSGLSNELSTKRLEMLKDAIPKLIRVGLLVVPGGGITLNLGLKEIRPAAQALKLNWWRSRLKPTPRG